MARVPELVSDYMQLLASKALFDQLLIRTTGQAFLDWNPADFISWVYEVADNPNNKRIHSTYLNNIHRSIDRLDTDVRALPHTYVSREDYKDDLRDIREMLGKIFDRLEAKQDK